MAVTSEIYGEMWEKAFNEEIDLLTDNIPVTLHTATYVPDKDLHDYQDDLTNELATANGYTVGGINAASKTAANTGATDTFAFDFADVVWTATGSLTARTAVVSCAGPGTAATNPLISYHQSDADVTATDDTWTFAPGASGLFTIAH